MNQTKIHFDFQIEALQEVGGIKRYFKELFLHLSNRPTLGVQHSCWHEQIPLDAGFDSRSIKSNFFRKVKKYKFLRTRDDKLISESSPDIVHKTFFYEGSRFAKAKTFITVFDMNYEVMPKYSRFARIKSEFKKRACEGADEIIAISHSTKSDLIKKFNVPESKVHVVYLGVSPDFLARDHLLGVNCESLGYKDYVLYVGKRGGYKNFKMLLDAFRRNKALSKNFQLIAFGGGEFTSAERAYIQQLDLPNYSIKHVSGNDEMLARYYRGARLMVYPSLYEGFGLPIIEAMACGCPVLTSNISSMPEVGQKACAYFEPANPNSLVDCLSDLLTDNASLNEFSKLGLAHSQGFGWEKTARETEKLYLKS
jgi:glycosyltransferase involved in cell wall biosynthesis